MEWTTGNAIGSTPNIPNATKSHHGHQSCTNPARLACKRSEYTCGSDVNAIDDYVMYNDDILHTIFPGPRGLIKDHEYKDSSLHFLLAESSLVV